MRRLFEGGVYLRAAFIRGNTVVYQTQCNSGAFCGHFDVSISHSKVMDMLHTYLLIL